MSDGAPADAAASADARSRLRTARRTNLWMLGLLIAAVAAPIFVHYTGFRPAKEMGPLKYPRIYKYVFRNPPDMAPHHGIDFSQIWLSARRMSAGQEVYYPVDNRKWRREWSSTYHPMIHWLYQPVGKLAFPTALVVHNLAGIGVLLLAAALALRRAGCPEAIPSTCAVIVAAMYLTPIGLFHLERGQMDVFVAAAIVCVVGGFAGAGSNSPASTARWGAAGAVVATLKVQAWIFAGFYWLVAAPLCGLRQRSVWWLPGTIAAVNLVFLAQVLDWIPSFLYVANNTSYFGPTFTRFLPERVAFGLPFASTALAGAGVALGLWRRGQFADAPARQRLLERISFPLAATLALQTVCATPVTHDYRLIAFLGLVPVFAIWCVRGEEVPAWLRRGCAGIFVLTLLFALRVHPLTTVAFLNMAQLLLLFSLLFLAAGVWLALRRGPAAT